jgi:heme exporter protein B
MGFNRMRAETWAVMYWVLMLFVGITSVIGEDQQKGQKERYMLHQLASPIDIYISKVIYQSFVLFLLACVQWLMMTLFFGDFLDISGLSLLMLALGAISLSTVLSFVSGVVSAAEKGSALATLLAFPIIIPSILLLIRMTYARMGLVETEYFTQDIWSLMGLDALLLGMGLVLYPIIWKS